MKILTVTAPLLVACSALAADFGLADWGATRDEIITAAGRPLEELEFGENHFLVYADTFAEHPAELWYWLEPGGALVAGVISAAEPSLATFYAWEEELSARFGAPEAADEFATTDEKVRARASGDDDAAREEDVRHGLYRLRRAWDTDTTLASLVAKGGAGEMSVDAILSSVKLGAPLFEAEEEAAPAEEEEEAPPPEETP
jgi:hypothetical protein